MRVAEVTANGLILPARIYSTEIGTLSNITCARPAIRSAIAGAPPRYGTWTMLTPVIILNSSPATCCAVPTSAAGDVRPDARVDRVYQGRQAARAGCDDGDAIFGIARRPHRE